MIALKWTNLAIRFVLELCVLAALAYWGLQTGGSTLVKAVLGLGVPLVAATVWGLFGAPAATRPVSGAAHLALEIIVFGSGPLALILADRPGWGAILAVVLIINRLLIAVLGGA